MESVVVSRRTLKASGYSGPLKGAASPHGADSLTRDLSFDRLQPVRLSPVL